jgi:hypothetical protein
MKHMIFLRNNKQALIIIGISLYVLTPFAAGFLGYYDPRGPLIYPEDIHSIGHRIGRSLNPNLRGKARIPWHEERTLLYRLDGFRNETFN